MNSFKEILLKIENVEKMHQKILQFFYIRKKNEIPNMLLVSHNYYVKTHGLNKPYIERNSRTYLRVVYMKND